MLGTAGSAIVTNLDTNQRFCSIQAANDAASTLAGHTIQLAARSPIDPSILVGQPLITATAIITKPITIRGQPGTVVTAPTGGPSNQRIFDVRSPNVAIEDVEITVNRPAAAVGIYATDQGGLQFTNLALRNNHIRSTGTGSTLTTPLGNTSAAGIALVAGGGAIERAVITGTTILSDTADSTLFSRGIWLREVSAQVVGSEIMATTQDLLFQLASDAPGNPAIDIQANTFRGAGVDLTEPQASVNVLGNTFQPVVPLFPQSLLVKHSYVGGSVSIRNNTFLDHRLAIFSGASRNVTIANNQFTPASGLTEYSHIQVDTGYPTAGTPLILPNNSAVIQGNTFNGAAGSTGRALDFQNSNQTGTATDLPDTTSGFGESDRRRRDRG